MFPVDRGCNQSVTLPLFCFLQGIDARCLHDSIQNRNIFVVFLSPHFRARDWLKPSSSCIRSSKTKGPCCVLCFIILYSAILVSRLCFMMTRWLFSVAAVGGDWRDETTEPVRGRPATATTAGGGTGKSSGRAATLHCICSESGGRDVTTDESHETSSPTSVTELRNAFISDSRPGINVERTSRIVISFRPRFQRQIRAAQTRGSSATVLPVNLAGIGRAEEEIWVFIFVWFQHRQSPRLPSPVCCCTVRCRCRQASMPQHSMNAFFSPYTTVYR